MEVVASVGVDGRRSAADCDQIKFSGDNLRRDEHESSLLDDILQPETV